MTTAPAGPGMLVRDATVDDAAAVAPLLAQLGYAVDAEILCARLRGHRQAAAIAIVATDGALPTAPLGFASMSVVPALHVAGGIALITSFVVAEHARRRGAGRALLGELESRARARGCARMLVTSGLHRADAHAFYESCGLPRTGIRFAKAL